MSIYSTFRYVIALQWPHAQTAILEAGTCFFTFITAFASHYFDESFWCCWFRLSDCHQTITLLLTLSNSNRWERRCYHAILEPDRTSDGCISVWLKFLWRQILCICNRLLPEHWRPCIVEVSWCSAPVDHVFCWGRWIHEDECGSASAEYFVRAVTLSLPYGLDVITHPLGTCRKCSDFERAGSRLFLCVEKHIFCPYTCMYVLWMPKPLRDLDV